MAEPNPFLPGAGPFPMESDEGAPLFLWRSMSRSGSKKPVNDDSWLAFASDLQGAELLAEAGEHSVEAHDLIFAVSDGMGGGNAGDVASSILLERLATIIPQTFKTAASGLHPDYFTHLEDAIRAVHEKINQKAALDESHHGMAATLALAWFTPENLYLANVGDSRIYLHRDDETEQLTLDHTFAWRKMSRGDLNERQFRGHPRRSALYEVVGGGHATVNPHVASIPYRAGDQFLICSDGLIDGLWDKHIHSAFLKNSSSTSQLADSLMERAATNDGTDDITLITIAVADSGSEGEK